MKRSLFLVLIVGVLLAAGPASAQADGTTTYVLGQSTGPLAYGTYGQTYCYPWKLIDTRGNPWPSPIYPWGTYYLTAQKHVSSFYVWQDDFHLCEVGIEISDESLSFTRDPSRQAAIFVAIEAQPQIGYHKWFKAPAIPDTWIAFEVNNHQMYAPGNSAWYAAWNGNTVLHGQALPGFWNGYSQGASERFMGAVNHASFQFLQYKRIQGNWAGYPGTTFIDRDPSYMGWMIPGFTNRFYVMPG